ncbi:MAG: hypothetical protein N2999_05895 [Proteobacteria bacterium]|nr:hypothetical protein [Pseudomonadota bacterium]
MIDLNISFLYQLILFWLVIIVLNNFFFKPMLKYLDYRKSLIVGRKKEAEEIIKEMEEKEKFYNEKIRTAKEQGIEYKKSVREEIIKEQKEIFEKEQSFVEEEFAKKRNEFVFQLESEKTSAKAKSEELARFMAGKILGREI